MIYIYIYEYICTFALCPARHVSFSTIDIRHKERQKERHSIRIKTLDTRQDMTQGKTLDTNLAQRNAKFLEGVASVSVIDKMIGLFYKRAL